MPVSNFPCVLKGMSVEQCGNSDLLPHKGGGGEGEGNCEQKNKQNKNPTPSKSKASCSANYATIRNALQGSREGSVNRKPPACCDADQRCPTTQSGLLNKAQASRHLKSTVFLPFAPSGWELPKGSPWAAGAAEANSGVSKVGRMSVKETPTQKTGFEALQHLMQTHTGLLALQGRSKDAGPLQERHAKDGHYLPTTLGWETH